MKEARCEDDSCAAQPGAATGWKQGAKLTVDAPAVIGLRVVIDRESFHGSAESGIAESVRRRNKR